MPDDSIFCNIKEYDSYVLSDSGVYNAKLPIFISVVYDFSCNS